MTSAAITRLHPAAGPKPPAGLARDGKSLWTELQGAYGITDAGGLLLLETACKSYDDWLAARRLLAKEGMTLPDRGGGRKIHPAARLVETSHRSMMSSLRQLHLDPGPLQSEPLVSIPPHPRGRR